MYIAKLYEVENSCLITQSFGSAMLRELTDQNDRKQDENVDNIENQEGMKLKSKAKRYTHYKGSNNNE